MTGTFITFEGIDFCGKSVQIDRLIAKLKENQIPFALLREPGGTIIAEKIRDILLAKENESMSPITEYLLFSAARAQLIQEKIVPALKKGLVVISDRYYDSSTAYQGYGRAIDVDVIHQINRFATSSIKPDLTFFIDIDIEELENRKKQTNQKLDRMEDQDRTFFERVRNGYLQIVKQESERFHIIDGTSTIDLIAANIWKQVELLVVK